jgi:hypothetical protein
MQEEGELDLGNIKISNENIKEYYYDSDSGGFVKFVNSIDKTLDYFYVVADEEIDLLKEIENNKHLFMCIFLVNTEVDKNKYLCSYSYFLLKNRLYKFDKKILHSASKMTFVLDAGDYIVKCVKKRHTNGTSVSFFREAEKEKNILEKLVAKGYDFAEQQKVVSYEITDNYIVVVRKKIQNARTFKIKQINKLNFDNKIKILKQVLEQLTVLESLEAGYVYNDLRFQNFLIDDEYNVYLIDLGSVYSNANKKRYVNITRVNTFNVIDSLLIVIYNLFNFKNNFFSSNHYVCGVKKEIYCANNYQLGVRELITYIVKEERTFGDVYNFMKNLITEKAMYDKKIDEKVNKSFENVEYVSINCIEKITHIFGEKIKSILEIQCGTYSDIQEYKIIKDSNIKYIGTNVNDEVTRENRQRLKNNQNNIFMTLDPINEPLPNVDLVVCSNILKHLSIEYIWLLFENIKNSRAKYLVIDYYYDEVKKLTEEPFYFSSPLFFIPTDDEKMIAVYDIKNIEFLMSMCLDPKLRVELVTHFEKDLNEIYTVFSKYNDGINLFRDVMRHETTDYDNYYYADNYKRIVSGSIHNKYLNLLAVKWCLSQNIDYVKNGGASYGHLINKENCSLIKSVLIDYIDYKYELVNDDEEDSSSISHKKN